MSYRNQQLLEIDYVLDRLSELNLPWNLKSITAQICQSHEAELKNGESPFHTYNTGTNVRKEVRERINERTESVTNKYTSPQLTLFGRTWEYLQERYVVTRDGEDVAVLLQDMTIPELKAKAKHHRMLAEANIKHANELEEVIAIKEMEANGHRTL